MPSTSPAQARFMAACAAGWKPDEAECPPNRVAKEFAEADAASRAHRKAKKRRMTKREMGEAAMRSLHG